MKQILNYTFILVLALSWTSCGDDDKNQDKEGNIEIAFKAQYDGQPLVLTNNYVYPDGRAMYFSRVSFYLSDLTLRTDETLATSDQVSYLMISQAHNTAANAAEGYKFNLTGVKSDDYTNLSFNIGVPPAQNAMTPSDFTSDNDLSLSGEYWGGWESYVFFKLEGKIDLDGDGELEQDFALHLGADEALVNVELDKNFSVFDDQVTEVVIPIELKNIFDSNGQIFDIDSNPKIHALSQRPQVLELAANLDNCFF